MSSANTPAVTPTLTPAMLAAQQRAQTEIEAALAIAYKRPRDEKYAVDRITNACQRPGLAERAEYQFQRGGSDICGASIGLMETIAAAWGNIEYGFEEIARVDGVNGKPGHSIVVAFAWDLETNTRRRTSFVVDHFERTKRGNRVMTDPRDIYEWVANQAQRRVRTCLENVIPRDVVETARETCHDTLRETTAVTPETIGKMLAKFAAIGVSKAAMEARIQRRVEAITPAQFVAMRRIYQSITDGMSTPDDWFPQPETTPRVGTKADALASQIDAMKSRSEPTQEDAASTPSRAEEYVIHLGEANTTEDVASILAMADGDTTLDPQEREWIATEAAKRCEALKR